jgi:hypothetical protein
MFNYSCPCPCSQKRAVTDGCDVTNAVQTDKDSATGEGLLASKILSSEIRGEEDNEEVSPEPVDVEESEDEYEGDEEGS